MANRRQKKKKSAAAAKQAAAQYKGKNAPVRPVAVPKKVDNAPEPQHAELKAEVKPQKSVNTSSGTAKAQEKSVQKFRRIEKLNSLRKKQRRLQKVTNQRSLFRKSKLIVIQSFRNV